MSIRDITVVITRETRGVTQRGFGLPLILSTEKDLPYTRYRSLADVAEDFPTVGETVPATYQMAAAIFRQSPRPEEIVILGKDSTVAAELTAALDAAVNDGNNDWYFLLCENQTPAIQTALAAWITDGLYFTATDDPAYSATIENDRVVVMVHNTPESYPDAAWVGRCAPTLPGAITWKFKRLNGIVASGLSDTEMATVDTNNGNYVLRQGGILHTAEGVATSGEFIDVMRTVDFIEARCKENVFVRLVNAAKIPFTNEGISMIVDGVTEALQSALNQGAIATGTPAELEGRTADPDEEGMDIPLFQVTAPTRAEVPLNDRANRTLPDVNFVAILAGAVHKVRINGIVRV